MSLVSREAALVLVLAACNSTGGGDGGVVVHLTPNTPSLAVDGGGTSQGLSREQLVAVAKARRSGVYKCFVGSDCGIRAKMLIMPSGLVKEAVVTDTSGAQLSGPVAACVEAELRRWSFPPSNATTEFAHYWECKRE